MRDLLPEAVLVSIQGAFLRGVSAAEEGYIYGQEDEDTLTGALGQALLLEDQAVIADGAVYVWRITYNKFRGRGRNATERILGADGIFQVEVREAGGKVLGRKGVLFQAKKGWEGKDTKLAEQAGLLSAFPDEAIAIIINYTSDGYTACLADTVYRAGGDRRKIPPGAIRKLATILGEEFLWCRVGVREVFYDHSTKSLYSPFPFEPRKEYYRHIVTTKVIRVKLEGQPS